MNDKETIEYLINNNLNLVGYCYEKLIGYDIKKYYKDDLFSDGYYALYQAALNYDKESNYKFSTFAVNCIRNSMYDCLSALLYKNKHTLSIDRNFRVASVEDGDLGDISFKEVIQFNGTDIYNRLEAEKVVSEIKELFIDKPKYLKAIDLFLNGYNYTEIGEELGKTRQDISALFKLMKKRYNKKYKHNEV